MQITVFGAAGKVGHLVVEEALRRGYRVVAFTHSHSLTAISGDMAVVQGDIYSADDVARALQGSDAVVSCLGSWGTPKKNVLTAAMRAIIPAMHEQKISRIVTLTGSGAVPNRHPGVAHRLPLKLLAPFPAGKVFRDGEEHMFLLMDSNLDWTTVRSPVMNNFGSSKYQLQLNAGNPFATIKRQAVADAMLDQLESEQYLRQAPAISRK